MWLEIEDSPLPAAASSGSSDPAYPVADAGQKGGLNVAGRHRPVIDQQHGICSVRQREGSERGGHGRLAKLRRPVSCPGQSIPKCTFFPFYYFLSLFLSLLLLKRKYSIFSLMPNDVIWTLEPQPSGRSPRRGTKGQKEARAAGPTGARTTGGGEPLPRPCRRGVSGMRARGLWLAPPPRCVP